MDHRAIKLLFLLLRSAIKGTELSEQEKNCYSREMLPKLLEISEMHDIKHLLVYALKKNGLLTAEDAKEEKAIFKAAYRYEKLKYELDVLCDALEKAHIPFIPLKGSVIRKYYPEPWMRTSCDIDVLVHEEDLDSAIEELCSRLDYTVGERWTHDVSLYSPSGVHIELHFDLVEEDRARLAHKLLDNVWTCAVPAQEGGYRYVLSDHMFYFYHVAHMAKHFKNGGCGIRSLMDLWILDSLVEHSRIERDELLKRGELLQFADSCGKLASYWFGGDTADELTLKLESYIICGGVYGSAENGVAAKQSQKGNKIAYIFSRLFPPLRLMQSRFPALRKFPVLLPAFWVWRVVLMLKNGRGGIAARELQLSASLTDEKSKAMSNFLQDIGL